MLTADLVEATRRYLLSGAGETLNKISGALDATSTTVTLARELRNVAAGTVLSAGLESMYVWDVTNLASRVLEVQRGYGGSTATTHADGSLVRVAPEFTDFAMFAALNDDIDALSSAGVYRRKTLDLTASSTGVRTYNLAADVLDVYDVRYDAENVGNQWPQVASWTWQPDISATEFPSGAMLRLDSPVPAGRTVRVRYKARLTRLATLTDDVAAVTGLPATALDIPPMGAAWRLAAPAEIERNSTRRQGDSRRAEEVPAGAKLRASAGLAQRWQTRVGAERMALARIWPPRSR